MAPARPQGSLYVISGPSGAGKGTLVKRALELAPDVWLSVSATTRAPREGEVDGREYHFMTREAFEELAKADGFIEWAQVHDNLYGTPFAPIRERLDEGGKALLEIDVQGAFQLREHIPEARLVFIAPPSIETLEARLRGRATDDEETIVKRMKNAVDEMEASSRYDVVIVNDDLDKATEELAAVLQS